MDRSGSGLGMSRGSSLLDEANRAAEAALLNASRGFRGGAASSTFVSEFDAPTSTITVTDTQPTMPRTISDPLLRRVESREVAGTAVSVPPTLADSCNLSYAGDGVVPAVVRGDSLMLTQVRPDKPEDASPAGAAADEDLLSTGDDIATAPETSPERTTAATRDTATVQDVVVPGSPGSSVPPSPPSSPSSTSSSPPSGHPPSRTGSHAVGDDDVTTSPLLRTYDAVGSVVVAHAAVSDSGSTHTEGESAVHLFAGQELIARQRIEILELEGRFERILPAAHASAAAAAAPRARQSSLKRHGGPAQPPRTRGVSLMSSRQPSVDLQWQPSRGTSHRSVRVPSTRPASSSRQPSLAPTQYVPPTPPEHHFISFSLSAEECEAEEVLSRRAIEEEWSEGRTSLLQIALMWAWRVGSQVPEPAPRYSQPPPPPQLPPYEDADDRSPSLPSRMCSSSPPRSFKTYQRVPRTPVNTCHGGYGEVQHQGWLYMARGGADAVWVRRFMACINGTMYCGRSEVELSPKVLFRASSLLAVEIDDRLKAAHQAGGLSAPPGGKGFGFLVILPPAERPLRSPSPSPGVPQTRTMRFVAKSAPERATWMAVLRDGMTSPHPFLSSSPPRHRDPMETPAEASAVSPSVTPRR